MSQNTIPIQIRTVTPVHIGTGVELQGNSDYLFFQNERKIAKIDPRLVLEVIGLENVGQWVAVIDQNQNLLDYLRQRKPEIKPEEVAQRVLLVDGKAPDPAKNAIKEQLHLGGSIQPSIPGSSLKGAIRTAILSKLIKDNPDFVEDENRLGSRKGQYMDYHAGQVEAHYLGKKDRPNRFDELEQSPNKDLLRFLRVGDAYFEPGTIVVRNTIINQFRHGWGEKKEESSFYECIPAGSAASASIQVPKQLVDLAVKNHYLSNANLGLLAAQRLFKLINEHTLALLEQEINFWDDEDNPEAIGDLFDRLQEMYNMVKQQKENSCILRVGAASGWEFMTGGWITGQDRMGDFILSDDTWVKLKRSLRRGKNYPDNTIFPKTRKMIEGGEPLGFVELSLT